MSQRLRLPRPAWIFTAFALVAVAVPVAVKVGVDHAARASFTDAGPGETEELGFSTTDPSDLSSPATGLGTPPPTLAGAGAGAGAGSAVSAVAAPEETTTTAPLPWNLGQRPFAARSTWNTPIPAGATYYNIGMPPVVINNYWVDWDAYAPAVWFSHPDDPLVKVTHPSGWGYPADTLQIHLPEGVTGAKGSDRSILIVDGTKVYNMWQFNRTSSTTATAAAFAQADVLASTGWGSYRGQQPVGAGITAVGHSMLAGLLVQAETDKGEIRHALQLSVDNRLNSPGFVGEAILSDGDSSNGIIKQGQRLAIPRDVPMPSGLSPLGQKVFRALQIYGAFDVDSSGNSTVLRAQSNAYDTRTIDKLRDDFKKMGPLLQAVNA